MDHDGQLFPFPGRDYVFQFPYDEPDAIVVSAVHALMEAVEPTEVEAVIGAADVRRFVSSPIGGAYFPTPQGTTRVDAIGPEALVAWLRSVGPVQTVRIDDGWFPVDAAVGSTLRSRHAAGWTRLAVVEHRDRAVVRAPAGGLLVPAVGFALDPAQGRLRVAVHASHWTDADGVGRARFDAMCARLAAAGWTREPDAHASSTD